MSSSGTGTGSASSKSSDKRSPTEVFLEFIDELYQNKVMGKNLHSFLKIGTTQFFSSAEWTQETAVRMANGVRLLFECESSQVFLKKAYGRYTKESDGLRAIMRAARMIPGVKSEDLAFIEAIYFIFVAASKNDQELLAVLDTRVYKLDTSVHAKPLNDLLDSLLKNKCLEIPTHKSAVKFLLSPMCATWSTEVCTYAFAQLNLRNFFLTHDEAALREFVLQARECHPSVAKKLIPIATTLTIMFQQNMVLRFEAICYVLHAARLFYQS